MLRAAVAITVLLAARAVAAQPAAVGAAEPAPAPAPDRARAPLPTTAVAALDRANAAYEYGEMAEVVEAARPVVEGAVPADEPQRVQALRLLGIGLHLTGRESGAETAFVQ